MKMIQQTIRGLAARAFPLWGNMPMAYPFAG
jgi:hypothetical protein